MKIIGFFLIIVLPSITGLISPIHSQQSLLFEPGIRIQANGINMKVDTYASVPCVVDWNEDGKKDLLVGCFYSGNIYLFLNSGLNSAPVFTSGTMLRADGSVISVAYG